MIGMEGAKTPAGSARQVRPRRRLRGEEAYRSPRGKRSAWNGNQQPPFTSKIKRTVNRQSIFIALSTITQAYKKTFLSFYFCI
ncbi:hypothetical protein CJ483_02175 [Bacillus sp. PK3_68]|nr:hypothetical protein CJ483_02175 [Bacillus sp. PK3_68]